MALSIATATWIVDCVRSDSDCLRQIQSVLTHVFPESWGITGGVRNLGFMAALKSPQVADPYICTGIADVTAAAIEKRLKEPPGRGDIQSVMTIGRRPPMLTIGKHEFMPVDHAATLIQMSDGSKYVFDWHATLNVNDPMMYPSKNDFMRNRHSIPFVAFGGWR
jgi:hypothetical protein